MKEYLQCKSLILGLTEQETRQLRKRLSSSSKGNSNQTTSLDLLDLILTLPEISINEVYQKLYKKRNEIALRKLIQRLINRIYDVFFINDLIFEEDLYDSRAKSIFMMERKMLLTDLLRYRGYFLNSDEILNEIISESNHLEYFEIQFLALNKKRLRLSSSSSEKELKKLDSEIKHCQQICFANRFAKKLLSDFSNIHDSSDSRLIKKEYEKGIKSLSRLSLKYSSKTLVYHEYLIQAQYYSLQGNDTLALDLTLELLEFVQNNKSINSNNRIGTVLLQMALYARNSNQFDMTLSCLEKSLKYLNRLDQTKVIVYYQMCIFYVITGDLSKLNYYLKLCYALEFKAIDTKLKNRLYFLNAFVSFINGFSNDSYKQLGYLDNHSKEDFNLEFNKRLLEIILLIDLEKFEDCDKKVESFRKFVSDKIYFLQIGRISKDYLKVILHLRKVGYDFAQVSQSVKDLVSVIQDEGLRNEYFIPFTSWFYSKVKNVPYDHQVAMKELQRRYKKTKLAVA